MAVTAATYFSGTPTTSTTSGSWATAANAAGAFNGTYAVWTSAGSLATGTMDGVFSGVQALVPAGSTISSVDVTVSTQSGNVARVTGYDVQLLVSGAPIGTAQSQTMTTSNTQRTNNFTGVSYAQLANLGARVVLKRAAVTQSAVGNIDAVSVVVTYTPPQPSLTQAAYRFYADGSQVGATALAAQNTGYTADLSAGDMNLQLRVLMQETNAGAAEATDDWALQYERNLSGGWVFISAATTVVAGYNSGNITEGGSTTSRLTGGTGTFAAGKISEDGVVNDVAVPQTNHTELLYSLTLKADDVDDADTLRFRVLRNGLTNGLTYSVYPTVTVSEVVVPQTYQVSGSTPIVTDSSGAVTVISPPAYNVNPAFSGSGTLFASGSIPGVAITDPRDVSGLVMWLDADNAASFNLTGSSINTWADRSGLGNTATAAVGKEPTLVLDPVMHKNVVQFVPQQWFTLDDSDITSATSMEVFFMVKAAADPSVVATSSGFWNMSSVTGSGPIYPWTDKRIYESFGSTVRYTFNRDPKLNPPPVNEWRVYGVSSAPLDWHMRFDGVDFFSNTTSNVVGMTAGTSTLGKSGTTNTYFANLQVAEMVLYNRVLSPVERQQVTDYLRSKWIIVPVSGTVPIVTQLLRVGRTVGSGTIIGANATIGAPTPAYSNVTAFAGPKEASGTVPIIVATTGSLTARRGVSGSTPITLTTTGAPYVQPKAVIALTGSGGLSASFAVTASGTATLSGAGTLGASGTASVSGSAAPGLSGAGTLSRISTLTAKGNPVLSGSGQLGATGVPLVFASTTAGLSGAGSLSAAVTPKPARAVTLTGAGTLGAVGQALVEGSAAPNLTGAGALTATATVHISGGGPPGFSPADLTGLAIWLDASQLALADGATVDTWPSQVGTLVGANFNVAPYRPTMRTNALNGKAVVSFTPGGGLRWPATGIDINWTVVYVSRLAQASACRVLSAGYPPANIALGYHGGYEDKAYIEGWVLPDVSHPVTTDWHLYTGAQDGAPGDSTVWFYSNGTLLSGGQPNSGNGGGWKGTFQLNGYNPTGGEETGYPEVAEVVFYDRKLSPVEQTQVEDYLRAKWLGAGLPPGGGQVLEGEGTLTATGTAGVQATAAPQLTGAGVLAASAVPKPTTLATLTGSGALGAAVTPQAVGVGPLSGTGSLSATLVPKPVTTTSLTGSGTLSAQLAPKPVAAATLSGSGSLGVSAGASVAGAPVLSGSGTITAVGTASVAGSAAPSISGTGTLSVILAASMSQATNLSGGGTLAATGSATVSGSAAPAVTGAGTLVASVTPRPAAWASLSGDGALGATGSALVTGTAAPALSGAGTLSSTLVPKPAAPVLLAGSGALAATSVPKPSVVATLDGSGNLSAAVSTAGGGTAVLSGAGVLAPLTTPKWTTPVTLSGTGALVTGLAAGMAGMAGMAGIGLLTSSAALTVTGSATLGGSGALSAAVATGGGSTATLSGSGSVLTSTRPEFAKAPALSGSGALTLLAVPTAASAPALTGAGALSASTAQQAIGTAALTGAGTLTRGVIPGVIITPVFSGTGTLSSATVPALAVQAGFAGTGMLSPSAQLSQSAGVALGGSGSLLATGSGSQAFFGTVALSGAGQLSGTVVPRFTAVVPLSGSGTLQAAGTAAGGAAPAFSGTGVLIASMRVQLSAAVVLSGSSKLEVFTAPHIPVIRAFTGLGVLTVTEYAGLPVDIDFISMTGVPVVKSVTVKRNAVNVSAHNHRVSIALAPRGVMLTAEQREGAR